MKCYISGSPGSERAFGGVWKQDQCVRSAVNNTERILMNLVQVVFLWGSLKISLCRENTAYAVKDMDPKACFIFQKSTVQNLDFLLHTLSNNLPF